jgi:hypothetical protein
MNTTTLPPSPRSRKGSVEWLTAQMRLIGGRKVALWPETRRRLLKNVRRADPRTTRSGEREQLVTDVRAEILLESIIAQAEAAGAVVVRDDGPVTIIELAADEAPPAAATAARPSEDGNGHEKPAAPPSINGPTIIWPRGGGRR